MSYLTASTRNTIGMKTLARQVGMSGFGALGTGAADAMDAGVSTNVVALLVKYGATDDQLEAIAQNSDSEDAAATLLQQLAAASAGSNIFESISTSFMNTWTNAWTGNLSQQQLAAIQQQEAAELVKAGMPLADAQSQATEDANTGLATFQGAGGLGIKWTGAAPGQSGFWQALESDFGTTSEAAASWFSKYWPWVLGGSVIAIAAGVGIAKKI